MTFTYDPETDRGKVRLLITDTVEANEIFADAEIDTFLLLEDANIFSAAACALETIATNEALVLKVISTLDLKTDGAKLADVLLKRAAALRERAGDDESDASDDFAVAEFADPVFGWRDRIARQEAGSQW